jgi:hypothetical protein
MKLCINCHTLNADDALFCSECGMSLVKAPTREPALKHGNVSEADHPEEARPTDKTEENRRRSFSDRLGNRLCAGVMPA